MTLLPGPRDGFYILQQPDEAQPDLDDFVARTIASKGDQHVGHAERCILAVDATFDDAKPLRLALDRSPVRVPWWQVYQVLRSDATLVYEETDQSWQRVEMTHRRRGPLRQAGQAASVRAPRPWRS